MPISPSVVVTVADAKNAKSTMEYYVPSGTALADISAWATTLATYLDAIINGRILRVAVCIGLDLGALGLANQANTNSDVEEGARFIFGTALPKVNKQVRVPTFLESKIVAGTRLVDTDDPDVLAFINHMTDPYTAPSTATVSASDYRDEDLITLVSAKEDFQTSRKTS